jgi:hypothetical protein
MALSDRRDQLRLLAAVARGLKMGGLDDYEPPSVVLEDTLADELPPLLFADVLEEAEAQAVHTRQAPEVEHVVIRRLSAAEFMAELGGDT